MKEMIIQPLNLERTEKKMNAAIQCPVLWDLEHCALYKVRICLYREEELLDQDCADLVSEI